MQSTVTQTADIPVIDISSLREGSARRRLEIGQRIDEANRRVGFLVIVGHGVDDDLIAAMHDVTEEFFGLPDSVKDRSRQPAPEISRGFIPARARSLAASDGGSGERDYVEYFAAGRSELSGTGVFDHRNIWPHAPNDFRSTWQNYYTALEAVGNVLLRGFALGLDLDEEYFHSTCADHCSVLFANGYPPADAPPAPGSVRLGAHTDYGSLTILYRDERPSGLQVRQNGAWLPVPDIPGSFVVNIGDLMARWTNDRWVSTLHRVAHPPVASLGERRLSIPYFHQPAPDAEIAAIPTCVTDGAAPKYPPITSGQNYLEKTRRSMTAVS
ncbi:isopenicillin N synthase family dioxygenase [Gordonia insulae]|uniref:2-oxoglutarate-dependent ethylene/succinate-forming enzyme n=1 Tax=Gordonia insulae TaxID=2420509 RepID=A0A3G8JTF0_9ACTN|nr:2OG-Fe(II) oxygenase family protein [Gordonia insulae]AZG47995.1 2-oxoglutarate-dependent ethylene/succinate-forming enzyme [Gordonia insulae]